MNERDHIMIGGGNWAWQPLDDEREVRVCPSDPLDIIRIRDRKHPHANGTEVRFNRRVFDRGLGKWHPVTVGNIEITAYPSDNASVLRVRPLRSAHRTTSNARR